MSTMESGKEFSTADSNSNVTQNEIETIGKIPFGAPKMSQKPIIRLKIDESRNTLKKQVSTTPAPVKDSKQSNLKGGRIQRTHSKPNLMLDKNFVQSRIWLLAEDDEIKLNAKPWRYFHDNEDLSVHPSYTKFKLPYDVVCRQRYSKIKRTYAEQFKLEMEKLEEMQPTAVEAARFHRIFCLCTLWPPLHTSSEVDYFCREFFKLPPKKQQRLDYLLREPQT